MKRRRGSRKNEFDGPPSDGWITLEVSEVSGHGAYFAIGLRMPRGKATNYWHKVPKELQHKVDRIFGRTMSKVFKELGLRNIRSNIDDPDGTFETTSKILIQYVLQNGMYATNKNGKLVANRNSEKAIQKAVDYMFSRVVTEDPGSKAMYEQFKYELEQAGKFVLEKDPAKHHSTDHSDIAILYGLHAIASRNDKIPWYMNKKSYSTPDTWIEEAHSQYLLMDVDGLSSQEIVDNLSQRASYLKEKAETKIHLFDYSARNPTIRLGDDIKDADDALGEIDYRLSGAAHLEYEIRSALGEFRKRGGRRK